MVLRLYHLLSKAETKISPTSISKSSRINNKPTQRNEKIDLLVQMLKRDRVALIKRIVHRFKVEAGLCMQRKIKMAGSIDFKAQKPPKFK